MCGIVGYAGSRRSTPIILEGLKRLEYRGYDSAGLAIIQDGGIEVVRSEGKLRNLSDKIESIELEGSVGIGHTRWATHGEATEAQLVPRNAPRRTVLRHGLFLADLRRGALERRRRAVERQRHN